MSGTWRPTNLNLPSEGLSEEVRNKLSTWSHVISQGIREANQNLDSLEKRQSKRIGSTSALLNFGSIGPQSVVERSINLLGANQNLVPHVAPRNDLGNINLTWSAYIVSNGVVIIRLSNPTTGAITPNTVTWNVVCI